MAEGHEERATVFAGELAEHQQTVYDRPLPRGGMTGPGKYAGRPVGVERLAAPSWFGPAHGFAGALESLTNGEAGELQVELGW